MSDKPISEESAKQNGNENVEVQIDDLARKLRMSMLVVLIFSVFALTVVALTTDMMLLREGEIILPFIQVGIPVVGFYIVAPLLIVLLHLNLLVRLILLARDIYNRSDGEKRSDDKTSFTMLFRSDSKRLMSIMREVVHATPFSSIVLLIQITVPLLALLVLQARFLAYQDESITLFHQITVTVDLLFQFLFMLSFSRLWESGKKFLRTLRYLIVSVLIAIPAFYAWAVALIPNSDIENMVKSDWQQLIAGCFFRDWWKEEEKLFSCTIIKGERFINVPNTTISLQNVPLDVAGALEEMGEMGEKPAPEVACEHIGELDLSERRLSFANFSGSKFLCVKMQGTQLNNSKLVSANLSTANLGGAKLRGAKLIGANLSGADLSWVDLSEADLRWAFLNWVTLWKADLNWSNLEGAGLSRADLRGTDLSGAKLIGADLSWADLREADLSGANLSTAVLSEADLSGADLRWTDLSWADLRGANFNGITQYETEFRGTIREGGNFSGSAPFGTSQGEVDGEEPERLADISAKAKHGSTGRATQRAKLTHDR